jgi:hypothetical protein
LQIVGPRKFEWPIHVEGMAKLLFVEIVENLFDKVKLKKVHEAMAKLLFVEIQ